MDRHIGRRLERVALRVSLTDACNFRCRYCRPTAGPAARMADVDELLRWIDAVDAVFPVRKLRLTGGEPLLHPQCCALIARLGERFPAVPVGVTTNGDRLAALAEPLARAGLRRVNVSLDAVRPEAFARSTGGGDLGRVLAGLRAARDAGLALRLNAVLQASQNADQLAELVRCASAHDAELRFIELMPIGVAAALSADASLDAPAAEAALARTFDHLGPVAPTDTARRVRLRVDGRVVVVGFIPAVSDPFCGRCDRFRLDASGRLWQCLRTDAHADLRAAEAAGGGRAVRRAIHGIIRGKVTPEAAWTDRAMVAIGG